MKQKQFVLQNKGMNRDTSISKAGESSAYENRNIRILARDNDTLLSVTNERGTKEISLGSNVFFGEHEKLVGWNVMGNHILLFTHDDRYVKPESSGDDIEPDPQYDTITYKYKVVTELTDDTIDASKSETVTATATRYKRAYRNGVPQGEYVEDADVTTLGFWARIGSEHVIISGNTISGISPTEGIDAQITSRAYASEYEDASLEVTGYTPSDYSTRQLVVTYASSVQTSTSQSAEAITLTALCYMQISTDGTTWRNNGEPVDVTADGFVFTDPENMSAYATITEDMLTAKAAGTVIVKSAHTPANEYDTVTIEIVEEEEGGGGEGGGGEDVPALESVLSPIWIDDNTIYFDLGITNLLSASVVYENVTVFITKTLSQESYVDGELEGSYSVGTFMLSGKSTTNPQKSGLITLERSRDRRYTYWANWRDWSGHVPDYYVPVEDDDPPETEVPVIDEPEEPSDELSLLALGDVEIVNPDKIYRIDYDGENFRMIRGIYTTAEGEGTDYQYDVPLFEGNLNLDLTMPIESVVYEETKDIKKIYWVDGLNVLRFMNFMEKPVKKKITVDGTTEEHWVMPWESLAVEDDEIVIIPDNTYFDSNRVAGLGAQVTIEKDNTGNTRANGTVQYLLTYFNKHGQETSYIWVSDLVYLSPLERGGGADETNNNRVTLRLSGLDTSYTNFRIYSVFRSSLNGTITAYLVSEQKTSNGEVTVVDDGAHLVVQDATRLLYLGSQAVVASTLAYKDQTLFLGDLKSIGRADYAALESLLRDTMIKHAPDEMEFAEGTDWESDCVSFEYTNDATGTYSTTGVSGLEDIPYIYEAGGYSYKSQLVRSSSQILTFKGGEKYRFALKFKMQDGTETDAFWIGDKVNNKYPVVDAGNNCIKRVVAVCNIPAAVITQLKVSGKYAAIQLCIAEASYADRSVKAQGIINPTMFNVWERYNKRNYAVPSWVARPRSLDVANRHFCPVHNSINSAGEIQCNYWSAETSDPVPYYQYKDYGSADQTYVDTYQSVETWNALMLVFTIYYKVNGVLGRSFTTEVRVITGDFRDSSYESEMKDYEFYSSNFSDTDWHYTPGAPEDRRSAGYVYTKRNEAGSTLYTITARIASAAGSAFNSASTAKASAWTAIRDELIHSYDIPVGYLANLEEAFDDWCDAVTALGPGKNGSANAGTMRSMGVFPSVLTAMNYYGQGGSALRWLNATDTVPETGTKAPAYDKKNLMFIDENVITLDSPEISYEAAAFDESALSFRIVGAAKLSSVISDYTVDATTSSVPGISLDTELFSGTVTNRNGNINGLTAWPLWKEYGLDLLAEKDDPTITLDERITDDYRLGNNVVRYWLYQWQRSGTISGYNFKDTEEGEKVKNASVLHRKVFANLRYSYSTTYLNSAQNPATPTEAASIKFDTDGIRLVNELPGAYRIDVGEDHEYYNGQVQMQLGMPGSRKYPIVYSANKPDDTSKNVGSDSALAYLSSNAPVLLEYMAGAHALISLPSWVSGTTYSQTILPYFFNQGAHPALPSTEGTTTGALLPWRDDDKVCTLVQNQISATANHVNAVPILDTDQYLFIGELYHDYDNDATDKRYGGISLNAVANNRFISAGPLYKLSDMNSMSGGRIYGNQGDTYFQRWDDLRIKPYSTDAENNVIDIVSAMLETHINLDGRTDKQRGIPQVASIDTTTFGQLNPVYSQQNNFSVRRDLDADFNLDSYRSSVTWTMQKSDMTAVDEWSHITLANTLKLDSDKGWCRALRMFNNNLIAFQDRGISEILFNSRTQVSTTDGVPIEIANSGKVDGKRYVSNKYGCLNKWSITEGKSGLYFVDNINKAFCRFAYSQYGRAGVDDLSTRLGFGNWFRTRNKINPWNPMDFNNFISFYDKVHSDVYLIKSPDERIDDEAPALVYNELLGAFTSFYDYDSVPMLANVEDRLVSFHEKLNGNYALWLQNEGSYGDFFGTYKPFWVQYRVTPDPYGDKVWTNVEYRADFYRSLSGDQQMLIDSEPLNNQFAYQPTETFDFMRFWNEYQTTETDETKYNLSPIRKFRIWRQAIPRAMKTDTNPFGLDRIRNPWLNLLFKKNAPTQDTKQDLMQLHDIIVTYYE